MAPLRVAVIWMARSSFRAFIIIFLLGFSARVFLLAQVPERRILPHDRWEDTAIATSLVERGEFADPYMIPTGPTAHLPPLVPAIPAFFWSLFGMGLAGGYAAKLFGMYPRKGSLTVGADADIVVFDPQATGSISAKTHHHKVDRNIFEGFALQGMASHVIVNGRVQFDKGNLKTERGAGRFIKRTLA